MLLRWLVNNYLRDTAEGKVRAALVTWFSSRGQAVGLAARSIIDVRTSAADSPQPESDESPPSGPRVCPLRRGVHLRSGHRIGRPRRSAQEAETSRQPHGVEHAGKLAGREVAIVEGGVGQQAAARATAEAISSISPKWVVSAGFAGGSTDELRRGHIMMADEVVEHLPASDWPSGSSRSAVARRRPRDCTSAGCSRSIRSCAAGRAALLWPSSTGDRLRHGELRRRRERAASRAFHSWRSASSATRSMTSCRRKSSAAGPKEPGRQARRRRRRECSSDSAPPKTCGNCARMR